MNEEVVKKEKVQRRTSDQIKIEEVKIAHFNVSSAIHAYIECKEKKTSKLESYFLAFVDSSMEELKQKISNL